MWGRAANSIPALALGLAMLLVGTSVPAQASSSEEAGTNIELTLQLQERIARLNDQWLVWNSAFLQNNRRAADVATRDLKITVEELGMKSLPDIAFGMIARGVDAAREGDTIKGRWALQMAESLEPGRPETELARSRIAYLEGDYAEAAEGWLSANYRLFLDRLSRYLWFNNLLLWVGCSLILAGGLFIAVQFAAKGGRICRDLAGRIGSIPPPFSFLVVIAVLCAPFVFSNGWIWVVLLWGALLWGYCDPNEKWVMALVYVSYGLLPVILLSQHRAVQVAVSDQMRAVDSAIDGRLYGTFLADLEKLRTTLPQSNAATHLIADAHEMLGQDQVSRPMYYALSEAEPNNPHVLNNLGVYHSQRGEHFKAIRYYERATQADPDDILGYYNLSQSYRELLEFESADRNLERARSIDPGLLAIWVNSSKPVQSPRAGLLRRAEIREELERDWLGEGELRLEQFVANASSAPLALLVPVIGLLIARFLGVHSPPPRTAGRSFLDRLLRWIVPGLAWAEKGNGMRALLSLFVFVLIATMPLTSTIGYRIPWGYDIGSQVAWVSTAILAGLFYILRVPHLLSSE